MWVLACRACYARLTFEEATELSCFGAQERLAAAEQVHLGLLSASRGQPKLKSNVLKGTPLTHPPHTHHQVLHPLAMQPAIKSGRLSVRVKNSYNRSASGTIITSTRDMSDTVVTSIVLKPNVTMVDIQSTRMLGAFGECCSWCCICSRVNQFGCLLPCPHVGANGEKPPLLHMHTRHMTHSHDTPT